MGWRNIEVKIKKYKTITLNFECKTCHKNTTKINVTAINFQKQDNDIQFGTCTFKDIIKWNKNLTIHTKINLQL